MGLKGKKEKKIVIRKRLNDKAFFNDSPWNEVRLSSALPLSYWEVSGHFSLEKQVENRE